MRKDDSWPDDGWLDDHLGQLDGQLRGILGARRISRREKRARAEQAIRAVDDLIERITEDLQQIQNPGESARRLGTALDSSERGQRRRRESSKAARAAATEALIDSTGPRIGM